MSHEEAILHHRRSSDCNEACTMRYVRSHQMLLQSGVNFFFGAKNIFVIYPL